MDAFGCLDEVCNRYSQRHQFVEMLALAFLGFLIPFTFGHPQILVGIIVNAFLIRSALSLPSYKVLPIIFTPSIGAIARGLLFGPFTPFLAYMLPFIWIGNLILVYAFKLKIRSGHNYFSTLLLGSAAKASLLYGAAFALHSMNIVPSLFLSAMGTMQLTTALLGGVVVYLELMVEKRF